MNESEYARWVLTVKTGQARANHRRAVIANEKVSQAGVLKANGRSDHQIRMTLGDEALSDPVQEPVPELQQAYDEAKAELMALGISEATILVQRNAIPDLWPHVS